MISRLSIFYRLFKASLFLSLLQAAIVYRKFGNDIFLCVKPADEKGEGLFTTKARKKGELVFIASGRLINAEFTKDNTNDYPNLYNVDKNLWLEPDYPFVKINHSCDPNTAIDGSRCFRALRDIESGEELTFDYSIADDVAGWLMKCNCGAKSCSGFVGPIQTISRERYLKSYPFIPSHIKKVYEQTHKPHKRKGVQRKVAT